MLGVFTLFGCNKDEIVSDNINNKLQLRERGMSAEDSIEYYASLPFANRDILRHQRQGERLNIGNQPQMMQSGGGIGCNCNGYTCNNISVLTTYCGPACDPAFMYDPFWNRISAIGTYGADPRQIYYVYYPANKNPSSPVVLLVHGGAWFSGPNPDNVNGWPFSYSDNSTDNLVKDLLNNGYVVVSILYRLARHGVTNTQITTNPIKISDQVNDINMAVNHIKTNFPSCIQVNVDKLQVLGESAGGHLALMWAYTQANTSYVKSVISCYAPTDLNDYADYLYNPPNTFVCNTLFTNNHFPWWFPIDDMTTAVIEKTFNYAPFTCKILGLPNSRVFELKKTMQSVVATVITNPYTNTTFFNNSPCNKIASPNNMPTFIMHGDDDKLVPYDNATEKMKSNLIALGGGLLAEILTTGGAMPSNYNSSLKHVIKKYNAPSGHGFGIADLPTVRANIIQWLNGHL